MSARGRDGGPGRGAVLVTGASTGIGAACVDALADSGFLVYAGVRRPEDGAAHEARGARAVILDVTDEESVRTARAAVLDTLAGVPLAGVVNNAGIAAFGPIEELEMATIREVLEVNAIGAVAVTRAFLPALRAARGRIVMMSSVSGRMAAPCLGAYAASKFALEAFSDSLRRELAAHGVHVTVIQPGPIHTPIWEKTRQRFQGRYDDSPYRPLVDRLASGVDRAEQLGRPTSHVTRAVVRAMTARRPPSRIVVARLPLLLRALSVLPDRVVDRLIAMRTGGG